jgi:ribosomal-protein-alanine N-acetyltransferase
MNLPTNRLIIRNLRETDLADFVEYRSDPEVCKFQGFEPFTREQGKEYLESLKDGTFGKAGKWNQLGIELKSENKLIGDIGLKPETGDPRIVECGVSFSTRYQGKGYAKEALTRIFDHLFTEQNIHRIIGVVDVENAGAIRLLESLRFRREAHFLQSFCDNGDWRDEFLYAMLEKDWKINQR